MASNTRVEFTTPVGRLVQGSLYVGNTTDAEGNVLLHKSGPLMGQPGRLQFFFSVAIPKGAEKHWAETEWGAKIWAVGHTAFPQAARSDDFSWKVVDGDSAKVNKEGNAPRDKTGFKGNWVLKFSAGHAPKIYRPEGSGVVQVLEADFVKPGNFVEVLGTIDGNGSQKQPGVYVNHSAVCFRGYSAEGEISFGPDVSKAGFGVAPLPPGASATPLGGTSFPSPGAPAVPAAHPVPSFAPAAPVMPPLATASVAPAVPVVPNPAFLNVPQAAPVHASTVAVPSPPASASVAGVTTSPFKMTALAGAFTREQFHANGWDDAKLIAGGYMTL